MKKNILIITVGLLASLSAFAQADTATFSLSQVDNIVCYTVSSPTESTLRASRNPDGSFDAIYFFSFEVKSQTLSPTFDDLGKMTGYQFPYIKLTVDDQSASTVYDDFGTYVWLANTGVKANSDGPKNAEITGVKGVLNIRAVTAPLLCEVYVIGQ